MPTAQSTGWSSLGLLALVAVGGAGGAVLRALLSMAALMLGIKPLWSTLCANVLGCLVAGLLLGGVAWSTNHTHPLRALVIVGALGGLTTFSAFSSEVITLLRDAHLAAAGLHCACNLLLGLGATGTGVWLASKFA